AGKTGLKCGIAIGAAARTRRSASGEGDGCVVVLSSKLKIELEGVGLSQIRREAAVFESVIEDSKPSAENELRISLIGKTETRREVCLLRITQPLAVFVGNGKSNVGLVGEAVEEGRVGSAVHGVL